LFQFLTEHKPSEYLKGAGRSLPQSAMRSPAIPHPQDQCQPLMLVNLNVLRARAEDVPKTRTHHATVTSFPADTHASFLVFLDIKMTFVVTVLADRDALQTRRTAF